MNINWDSIDDLKQMRAKIDRRINQLATPIESKKKKSHATVFNACLSIANADISVLYSDVQTDTNTDYYVYAHCDPFYRLKADQNGKIAFAASLGLNSIPFYIGKGTGKRAFDLNRNEMHRKKRQMIESSGKQIDVIIIKDGLSELNALMMESKLIDIFGLISFGGWLINLDEGTKNLERRKLYDNDFLTIHKRLKCIK